MDTLPPIVQAGHPALRQHAAPFEGQLNATELSDLIDLMRKVMHEAPGVGLAAPQLGIPLQLAVLEDQFEIDKDAAAVRSRTPLEFFAILNPSYSPLPSGTAAFFEGCLSLSGLQAVVERPESVRLEYLTPGGESPWPGTSTAGRPGSSSTKRTTCTERCTSTGPSSGPSPPTANTRSAGLNLESTGHAGSWGSCRSASRFPPRDAARRGQTPSAGAVPTTPGCARTAGGGGAAFLTGTARGPRRGKPGRRSQRPAA